MGNTACYNCFSNPPQSNIFNPEPGMISYDNSSMLEPNPLKSLENEAYDADPPVTQAISKSELIDTVTKTLQKFLEEIRQEPDQLGYKKVSSQKHIDVYLKEANEGFSLMSIWKCGFAPSQVAKFLKLVDIRKDWDTNISECKKICDITEDIAVYYMLYKRFLMMAPRDVLTVGQQLQLEDAWVDVSTSINSSLVPENSSFVRAHVVLAGFHIQTIEKDEDGNITLVTGISQANFGQSLNSTLIKNISTSLTPKFIKAMIDGMKKFEKAIS